MGTASTALRCGAASLLAALASSQAGPLVPGFGCDLKNLQPSMDAVEVACCGRDDACNGVPSMCSIPCALVFAPWYAECGVMLGRLLDDDAAGSAQVEAFDALDTQCAGAVDLPVALGMLRHFMEDDHDLLLSDLDGFETYRSFDPQTAQTQNGAMSTELSGCADGWTAGGQGNPCGGGNPGGMDNCCQPGGACGMRCPNTPSGPADPCIVSITPDHSDCPAPPAPPGPPPEAVTVCTQAAGGGCTPRECAAACSAARGCVSFRYQKQEEAYSNGQRISQNCGGMMAQPPPPADDREHPSNPHLPLQGPSPP